MVSSSDLRVLRVLKGKRTWWEFLLEPYLRSCIVIENKEKGVIENVEER